MVGSLISWPFAFALAAATMLNNHDATTGEKSFAMFLAYGPYIIIPIGLGICIYGFMAVKR